MRRSIALLAVTLWACHCAAAGNAEGRWEGAAAIPGSPLRMVVDLARDASGQWRGSIIVPTLGIRGNPLDHFVATPDTITFDLGNALRAATFGPTRFRLRFADRDIASGEFEQGGNVAPVSLRRIGAAQVEVQPRSSPLAADLVAQWSGSFELDGYPRQVTIRFARGADGRGSAQFTVVGKQVTNVPVDLVMQTGDFVRVESNATPVSFEGRFLAQADEIRGTIALGSTEFPLVLKRTPGGSS
jgi:hypothetical protein